MAFCVELTEHRTTYPAAIGSDANRNVKTGNLKPAAASGARKEMADNNLVDGSQDLIMSDFHQLVVF